jgi:hypothetical protein
MMVQFYVKSFYPDALFERCGKMFYIWATLGRNEWKSLIGEGVTSIAAWRNASYLIRNYEEIKPINNHDS